MSYRVEFCGVAVYPLDLSPKEACGRELPCPDHDVCTHVPAGRPPTVNIWYCRECNSRVVCRDNIWYRDPYGLLYSVKSKPPRYDDVYFTGVAALDKL